MKQILDERSMVEGAREEGKIQGRLEVKIEGKEENAIEFLRLGVNEEIIAQGTGLNIERIRELKNYCQADQK